MNAIHVVSVIAVKLSRKVQMKKFFALCFWVLLMVASTGTYAEEIEPDVLIKNITQEVLSTIKQDKDIHAGNQKKVLEIVNAKVLPNFDFERMARLAVGKNWRNATPEQKMNLVAEFRNLLVRNYTNVLTRYEDQSIEIKPFKMSAGANEATIKTLIINAGARPVAVDYEMGKSVDGWKVFDLTVEGVSLVEIYRSTFSEQIRQTGIDGLIKTLVAKNAANNGVVE